jgi:hypothetical protein
VNYLSNLVVVGLAAIGLLSLAIGRIAGRRAENPNLLVAMVATVAIVAEWFRQVVNF